MDPIENDEEAKKLRLHWFLILGGIWMGGDILLAIIVYASEAATLAERTGLDHWWHNNDPSQACFKVIFVGLFGLGCVFGIAHLIGVNQAAEARRQAQKNQELQAEREKLEFEAKVQDMEKDSDKQATLSKAAQSKQELIMRLGSIDQFIRVVAVETDVSKRTVALQAGHSEMTTLAAKLASGQISREALDAPEIREHASETSKDLVRLGLSEDRLNRDIIRMFKLNVN